MAQVNTRKILKLNIAYIFIAILFTTTIVNAITYVIDDNHQDTYIRMNRYYIPSTDFHRFSMYDDGEFQYISGQITATDETSYQLDLILPQCTNMTSRYPYLVPVQELVWNSYPSGIADGRGYLTTDYNEAYTLAHSPPYWMWMNEGIPSSNDLQKCVSPTQNSKFQYEIYHLYNVNNGDHIYTTYAPYKNGVLAAFPGTWIQHTSLGFTSLVLWN